MKKPFVKPVCIVFLLCAVLILVAEETPSTAGSDVSPAVSSAVSSVSSARSSASVSAERCITGSRYYLDPVSGDDKGDGSTAKPWKTLARARSGARSGDGVYLRSGNYGFFLERESTRSGYVIFLNEKGAVPVFSGILLEYKAKNTPSFLVFSGIRIIPEPVAQKPGTDPQDPNATLSTYAKTLDPVTIRNASKVMLVDCELSGVSKYLTEVGVLIEHSTNIRIETSDLHDIRRGFSYDDSRFLEFMGNHIHHIAASAFRGTDGKSTDILIEGNHAHDSNYEYSEDYCPRALNANNHGSAVAILGDRITIRNNIFHDGFNSAGIMTYDKDNSSSDVDYTDILIENNIVYDLRNNYVLRLYLIKSVVVRNNLFIGHRKSSGAQYYDTSILLHSLAAGATGSALTFSNNVVIGITNFGQWWPEVKQSNNMFYSCRAGTGPFMTESQVGGKSLVASVSKTSDFFERGFFENPLRFDWDTSVKSNSRGHGVTLNFALAANSPAIGFGDPSVQPEDGIGPINDKGFIERSPVKRTLLRHNAGPWQ